MTISIIRNGVKQNIEIDMNSKIKLDNGDQIIIYEYLKYFEPLLAGTDLILNGANGEYIVFENIIKVLQDNNEILRDELTKNSLMKGREIPEDYTYISFLDDPEVDDNIIDTIGGLYEMLEAAEAGQILSDTGSGVNSVIDVLGPTYSDDIAGRGEGFERDPFFYVEDPTSDIPDIFPIPFEELPEEPEVPEIPEEQEYNIDYVYDKETIEHESLLKVPVTIPTIEIEQTTEVPVVSYVDKNIITQIQVPVTKTTEYEVIDEEANEESGIYLNDEMQWVKIEQREFVESVKVPTEITSVATYNLNQAGDYYKQNLAREVQDITIGIKSYKTSKDDGEINLYNNGELVKTINLDKWDLNNESTMLNIHSDVMFDSFGVIHTGTGSGNGANSQEFKITGYEYLVDQYQDITVVRDVEVPTEPITKMIYGEETFYEYQYITETVQEEVITYETVTEVIEIPDPNFDTSNYILEGDTYYEYQALVDVEEVDILNILTDVSEDVIASLSDIDDVNEIYLQENININLDDLLINSEYNDEGSEVLKIYTEDIDNIQISDAWVKMDESSSSYIHEASNKIVEIFEENVGVL